MSITPVLRHRIRARCLGALGAVLVLVACGDSDTAPGEVDAAAPADSGADAAPDDDPDAAPDAAPEPDAGDNSIADCVPSGDQLLSNPEFDDEDDSIAPWESTGEVELIREPGAYSVDTFPNGVGVLTGVGGEGSARLSQRVEIPTGTTVLTLSLKRCIQNEVIHGDADELTIALESAEGDELDVLATLKSSDSEETNCSYLPQSASLDPAGRYDGSVAYLVVAAETGDNDQATFFLDTFALRASCP